MRTASVGKRLAPLAGLTLLLAACGGSAAPAPASSAGAASSGPPATAPQIAAYKGADLQQMLEAGARKEGTVSWYTSLAGPVIDSLTADFKKKYPYLQVDVFRAAEDQLVTRATQEAQAGKQVFDVLESPPLPGLVLGDAKLITPFYSPGLAAIPQDLQQQPTNGLALGATIRISFIGYGYNTSLIPSDAVPKTNADLLNPALAGKIQVAGSSTGSKWVGSVLHGMGDGPGKKFLQELATKQKIQVQQLSGKALLDLIAKGEVASSPTIFQDHVDQAAAKKAPVKWVGLDPVVANTGQVSFATKAPHPHAGMLFVDYLLGDGQKVLKAQHYALPTEKAPFTYWVPEGGRTAAQAEQDLNTWTDLFKQTFR